METIEPSQDVSVEAPADAAVVAAPPKRSILAVTKKYRFEFSGTAREYFRIWIVNLALSILSLGVYSAWAKVRTQRYFYANTRLDGIPFEYLARPWPILKGRLIALVLFGSYLFATQFAGRWRLLPLGFILLLTPWLVVRGAAFRARYSSWRGLSFRFARDYGDAYKWYLLAYLATACTFGIFYPYQKGAQKRYFVEQHRYANRRFEFKATPGKFYSPYLAAFGAIVVWLILSGVLMASIGLGARAPGHAHGPPATWTPMLITLFIYLGYFVVWAFLAAALNNLLYRNTTIGKQEFDSQLQGRMLLWIYTTNTLAILASVGMLVPWAQIRLAKYRADSLTILVDGTPDDFARVDSSSVGALGVEMDGLFDIDIGL